MLQSSLHEYGYKNIEVVGAMSSQKGDEIILSAEEQSFLQKPMIMGRVLSNIERILKQGDEPVLIGIGPFMLDKIANCLMGASGESIKITEKERDMLLYLKANAPDSVSRQDLLESVWGYGENINTHTLETHIYRLRQKIEKNTSEPELLITDGDGYRLEM